MADLSCYMTIINNTPHDLSFANKSTSHGYWEIAPPSIIRRFTSSEQFQAKDPSGAAAGSEGSMEYTITLPETKKTYTFKMKFCCSWSADNNYCYFVNPNPALFSIYFRAKSDGSFRINDCPESGHPLHLEFYIEIFN